MPPKASKSAVMARVADFLRTRASHAAQLSDLITTEQACNFTVTFGEHIRNMPVVVKYHESDALMWKFCKVSVVRASDDSNIEEMQRVHQAVAFINDVVINGHISVCPLNGEICFSLGHGVADQLPTYEQLDHMFARSLKTIDHHMPFLEQAKDGSSGKTVRKMFLDKIKDTLNPAARLGQLSELRQLAGQLGNLGQLGDLDPELRSLLAQLSDD